MSLLPKKLLSAFKPTRAKNNAERNGDPRPEQVDIIRLLWERNMIVIVRKIFMSDISPEQLVASRRVSHLWRHIIDQEVMPHLPHLDVTRRWTKGKLQVTDMDYLKHLGNVSHEEILIHMIVPLEKFVFILLTQDESNILMVYELDVFKACVTLPAGKIERRNTLIKLGNNTVNIIRDKAIPVYHYVKEFSISIISLDDYQVICEKLSIDSAISSIWCIHKMKETIWTKFRPDGSLDINMLTNEEPFHEIIQNIPSVNSSTKAPERDITLSFHHDISKAKEATHMIIRQYFQYKCTLKLVDLASQTSEHLPYGSSCFFTDGYLLYAKDKQSSTIIKLTIKKLSDGSEKKIKLVKPKMEKVVESPKFTTLMNRVTYGAAPGSNVAMFCHEVKEKGNYPHFPCGYLVCFVDVEKGVPIGGKQHCIYINTDASFKMLTPSIFIVAATGEEEQKCFVFRMSDNKRFHKDKRDISKDVADVIGGIPSELELNVHIEHNDPRSSPQFGDGNDQLIFSLGGKDPSRNECPCSRRRRCYPNVSKIYLVKFT